MPEQSNQAEIQPFQGYIITCAKIPGATPHSPPLWRCTVRRKDSAPASPCQRFDRQSLPQAMKALTEWVCADQALDNWLAQYTLG